jgi:predicted DNA-binding protein YlxM (UPF0122 family)
VGMTRYFEDIRYMLTIYMQFYNNSKANFTTIAKEFAKKKTIVNDTIKNNVLNLNNFNQSIESRDL